MALSPFEQLLMSRSKDSNIKLWKGHSKSVNSVVFSHDGHFIASGSDDNSIKLWKKITGNLIRTLKRKFDENEEI